MSTNCGDNVVQKVCAHLDKFSRRFGKGGGGGNFVCQVESEAYTCIL